MNGLSLGFAICGSFCTFRPAIDALKSMVAEGYKIVPIMSEMAYQTDTRFGKAQDFIDEVETICGRKMIHTIVDAEPIGPKNMVDVMVVCPCTGNTLAKIVNSITDTSVTMAVKSHMRNRKPVVLALATNDALAGSAKNIGLACNSRNLYFVPLKQDDPVKKPTSVIADFGLLKPTIEAAVDGRQIEPTFL